MIRKGKLGAERGRAVRVGLSLGSLLGVEQVLECLDLLKSTPDRVWIPETWGVECFSMLAAAAGRTKAPLGSSIVNTYSRSPALAAMGAVTVDRISGGRMVLGLGTSSPAIVEGLHSTAFEAPLSRMREYVEVVRLACSGDRIDYDGYHFKLRGFKLLVRPVQEKIPIYMAAVNHRMLELASDVADGVLLYLRPLSELKQTVQRLHEKKIDVVCQLITAVSDDAHAARARAARTLAFYISVGRIYREFLASCGYDVTTISNAYKSGLDAAVSAVPESMLDDLTVCGTPSECRAQLDRFRHAGIDAPIIQFNPVGNVRESFQMVAGELL